MDLDDPTRFGELDPNGMLEHIGELPQQCRAAWALTQELELPPAYEAVRHIVILGMGGSAIGGALLQGLMAENCAIPITVVRDYVLPAFVRGPDYLVVGCSYSGNTEETLSAFGEAMERGVWPAAVTTGGALAALAQEKGIPLVRFDYQAQPRAVLGYSFTLLLGLCCQLGLVRDYSADLEEAAQVRRSDLRCRRRATRPSLWPAESQTGCRSSTERAFWPPSLTAGRPSSTRTASIGLSSNHCLN